jgi:hypothetical protein
MSKNNFGDIKVYKDVEYTRGYMGRFMTLSIDVSSIEIETTYIKDVLDTFDNFASENLTPTIRTVDTIKGKAITPPLYGIDTLDKKIINEVDISFGVSIDLLKEVEENTEEVKKEFNSDNMFYYEFEMKDLVGCSFLNIDSFNTYIRVILDFDIYDILIKGLKENRITDISLEIVYYSVFTKTNLEYDEKIYGCVLGDSDLFKPSSFGVVKEITFKEHSKVMEVGRQALLEKDKAAIEEKIEKLSSSFATTLDTIRFNVKTVFIVLGIMVFISLFF